MSLYASHRLWNDAPRFVPRSDLQLQRYKLTHACDQRKGEKGV